MSTGKLLPLFVILFMVAVNSTIPIGRIGEEGLSMNTLQAAECCKRMNETSTYHDTLTECIDHPNYECNIVVNYCTCELYCDRNCICPPYETCRPSCSYVPFVECIYGCLRKETTFEWYEYYVLPLLGQDPNICNPMICFCESDPCEVNPAKKPLLGTSCDPFNPVITRGQQ